MSIKENYKGHEIIGAAVQLADSEGWQPQFTVVETSQDPAMVTPRTILCSFAIPEEAERKAMLFAINWIDNGKTPL